MIMTHVTVREIINRIRMDRQLSRAGRVGRHGVA